MLKTIRNAVSYFLPVVIVGGALVLTAGAAGAPETASAGQPTDALDKSAASELKLADTYLAAGDWDDAIKAYVKAAASDSEATAKAAREGLAKALKARDASPLGLREGLPAPFSRWHAIDYAVYAVGVVIAVFALAPLVHAFAFRVVGPFARWTLKQDSESADWRVSISGTAKEPQRSMLFDEFVVTMRDLSNHSHGARELSAIGKTGGRLFTPISLTDLVGPKLVVRGINIGQVAKAIQVVLDYFSYRFEVRIDANGKYAYVYASLRWGGLTQKTWQIPSIDDDAKLGYREIGRQLAYSVFGDGLVRQ
jgi:hypothetical protein